MMFPLPILALVVPLTVRGLDSVTSRTAIRLWHDIHLERKTPHDFQMLLQPSLYRHNTYVGGVVNGEVRTIAICERNDSSGKLQLCGIACAPAHDIVGDALVELLARRQCGHATEHRAITIDPKFRELQPRWFIAFSYYANETLLHP